MVYFPSGSSCTSYNKPSILLSLKNKVFSPYTFCCLYHSLIFKASSSSKVLSLCKNSSLAVHKKCCSAIMSYPIICFMLLLSILSHLCLVAKFHICFCIFHLLNAVQQDATQTTQMV